MKKIVVKVCISCKLCKVEILKAVTKLKGIDEVSIDEEKGTLTVTGEVDPVLIIRQLRKIKKAADIVSVGPKKPPKPKKSPKPKPGPKPPSVCTLPPCCNSCRLVAVPVYDDGYEMCSIL